MPTDAKEILAQIEAVLQEAARLQRGSPQDELSDRDRSVQNEAASLVGSAVLRLAPPASYFANQARDLRKNYGNQPSYVLPQYMGLLRALKTEYASGSVQTFAEL